LTATFALSDSLALVPTSNCFYPSWCTASHEARRATKT